MPTPPFPSPQPGLLLLLFIYLLYHNACGVLVPRPGIEPMPPTVAARSPNHWATRKVPAWLFKQQGWRGKSHLPWVGWERWWGAGRGNQSVKVLVSQSCPTLCNPVDCTQPGSSVHGIFQARTLEWVAIPFSRASFLPKDQTQVSHIAG